ncbi:Predicted protein [Marinactinospora thermotolerans DSM 45154]|uniref:Phosphodiester glycosidase domain-containing protein n=1 Tax=Marinactinospora thermotolerans DSM 45154 TaxID=1122192 RepID=A0A1T4M839_9ACTN|nr:Predicted protein [Marinactinospora thermotolerans DSM 45154]
MAPQGNGRPRSALAAAGPAAPPLMSAPMAGTEVRVSVRASLCLAVALLSPAALLAPVAPAMAAPVETVRRQPVAPGVELVSSEVGSGAHRQRFTMLRVDLSAGPRLGYLDGGRVAGTGSLHARATAAGAVAAVNGDFFDIGGSDAPLGAAARGGEVVKSPSPGHGHAVLVAPEGRGRIGPVSFSGAAVSSSTALGVDRLNAHEIPVDGLGVFTPAWGEHPRGDTVPGAGRVREVLVEDGVVTHSGEAAGAGTVPEGGTVLLGRGEAADRLGGLRPGDRVEVDYTLTAEGVRPHLAIGGRHVLLRDGVVADIADTSRHPRTAIGFSADGRRMYAIVADGRYTGSPGATLREMGERMRAAGADDALELDGGGSAALLARSPGDTGLRRHNRTGEEERPVPNGLAVHAPRGDGRASGLWVRPRIDPLVPARTGAPVHADPHRVFSGLLRRLEAVPHDAAYGPVEAAGRRPATEWDATSGRVSAGAFTAGPPGSARVSARAAGVEGAVTLEVLPPPQLLEAAPASLALPDPANPAVLALTGVAPDGTRAPIEPEDVTVDVDPELLRVVSRADGTFAVTATVAAATTSIGFEAAGRRVSVPVRVGTTERELASFDDAASWSAEAVRATASVAAVAGRDGTGLALDYDFTGSTGTRAAYALAPSPLPLGGHATRLWAWVRGDGMGARLAATVIGADGRRVSLHGPTVDWTGWRRAEIPVGDAVAHPAEVERLYLVETRSAIGYRGGVVLDGLGATVTLGE